MQVNRVNQPNQQANFTSAYTKYFKSWQAYVKRPVEYKRVGEPTVECVKAIFSEAKSRIGLLLNDNGAKLNIGIWSDRPVGSLPVALTQDEAQEFSRLTEIAEKIKYLNKLFADDYKFSQGLTITQVEDANFMRYIA